MKQLWLKVAETGAARIYSMIVSVVCVLLTARLLGPAGQGVLAASVAWATLFASFAGLSLGQVIQYRIQLRRNQNWLPDTFGTLLLSAFVLTLLAYAVAFFSYIATTGQFFKGLNPSVLIIAFLLLPLLIWEQYSSNLLAAADKLRTYNVAQYIGRTFWLIGILTLLIILDTGIRGALFAQVAGQALVAFVAMTALWKMTKGAVNVNKIEMKKMFKDSAMLHFNTVGSYLLSQSGILILNHYSSKAEVGWYQLANQMITIFFVIPQTASLVLFSKMSKVGPDKIWPEQKRLILYMLGLIVLISAAAYGIIPFILSLLVGPEFEPSVKLFRLLLPAVLGMSLAHLMTPQWIGRGLFLPTSLLTFFTAIANVIANAVLIPEYGAVGAIWASLVCFAGITVVVQIYFAWWCEKKYRQSLRLAI